MTVIILFVVFGYSVMSIGKPFHVAALYTALLIIAIIFGALIGALGSSIGSVLIGSIFLFIYSSFLYYLLDRFGDGVFMFLAILFCGALGLFFVPMSL